jgi:translin
MEGLAEAAEEAICILEGIESKREHAIRCSRDIIRETKRMIRAIHVSEDHTASKETLGRLVSELLGSTSNEPALIDIGPVNDALMEYAEAMILDSIVRDGRVPSFGDLRIDPQPWVMGLADCIGEMRRMVLSLLISDDVPKAERLFMDMEEMFHTIMMFDVPDSILPIRRKQDIARGVIERTHTDVANAVIAAKIRK